MAWRSSKHHPHCFETNPWQNLAWSFSLFSPQPWPTSLLPGCNSPAMPSITHWLVMLASRSDTSHSSLFLPRIQSPPCLLVPLLLLCFQILLQSLWGTFPGHCIPTQTLFHATADWVRTLGISRVLRLSLVERSLWVWDDVGCGFSVFITLRYVLCIPSLSSTFILKGRWISVQGLFCIWWERCGCCHSLPIQ